MNRRRHSALCVVGGLLVLAWFLAGCSQIGTALAPTEPPPTATPEPTVTPSPIPQPTATAVPQP